MMLLELAVNAANFSLNLANLSEESLGYGCPPNTVVQDMISPYWRIIIAFCLVNVVLMARDMVHYEKELIRLGGKPTQGLIVSGIRFVLSNLSTGKNPDKKDDSNEENRPSDKT